MELTSPLCLYMWTVLNNIHIFSVLMIISILIALIICMTVWLVGGYEKGLKWIKMLIISLAIFSLLVILIPNKKEAAIIFGVPYIINTVKDAMKNIDTTSLPPKAVDYLNAYLDKEIDNLGDKK